jgi:hypothetical protein
MKQVSVVIKPVVAAKQQLAAIAVTIKRPSPVALWKGYKMPDCLEKNGADERS